MQAAALVDGLGNADLSRAKGAGDLVYFDVLSLAVVRYPVGAAPWLAAIALAFVAAVLALGLRRRRFRALGAVGALLLLAANVLLVWLVARFVAHEIDLDRHEGLGMMLHVALAVAITVGLFALARRIGPSERAAASLVVWAGLALLSSLEVPGASYLALWPLAFSSAATGLTFWDGESARATTARWIATGLVTLLMTPVVYLALLGLTLRMAPFVAPLAVLWVWLLPRECRPMRPTVEDSR